MQYRRLTAHLQTGSVDFNRRLAAYLTNQVAMRSAVDQMVTNSYAQQYPNAPQFAHNQQPFFPSPMMQPPKMPQSPHLYRTSPYPSPYPQGFRPQVGRSASIATPQDPTIKSEPTSGSPSLNSGSADQRRMSMPAPSVSPTITRSPKTLNTNSVKPDPDYERQTMSAPMGYNHAMFGDLPLQTSLAPEAQQMLGPALDYSDPFTSMLMAGSEPFMMQGQYNPWENMNFPISKAQSMTPNFHPSYNGMSATLAPSALDMSSSNDNESFNSPPSAGTTTSAPSTTDVQPPTLGLDFSFDGSQGFGANMKGIHVNRDGSGYTSGQVTPGDGIWDFIDGGWGEELTASQG